MRPNRLIATVIFLVGVMTITGGCTTDTLEPTEQLRLSSTPPLLEKDTTSYTDKVVDTIGGYYDETVSFLTDDCGVGGYSVATGKAVTYGLVGGLWGAGKATMYGALHYSDSLEGVVIGAAVGSGLGLVVGVKNAYDGFKEDTAGCSS